MRINRLLLASTHSYIDHSSGAALATRDLPVRGWDCRALTCGVLDYEDETPLDDVLAALEQPARQVTAALSRGGQAEVFDLELEGVRAALMPTNSSRAGRSPNPREGAIFLDLAERVFDRFRPAVLFTYGGHPISLDLMRRARQRNIPVIFHLHNFSHTDRRGFGDASAILAPTECARRHYTRRLGLDCMHIPLPLNPKRVLAAEPEPKVCDVRQPAMGQGHGDRGARRA